MLWRDSTGSWFHGGFFCGPVILQPDHNKFLGADVANSGTVELSGLISSLAFTVQYRCRSTIFYDCTPAAHTADSTWKSDSTLASTATAIYNIAFPIGDISLVHEYGHSGNPTSSWMACVQPLAKAIVQKSTSALLHPWLP